MTSIVQAIARKRGVNQDAPQGCVGLAQLFL